MRKGFVFTLDIMMGISLILIILIGFTVFRFEHVLPEKKYEKLGFLAEDIINVLSYLEVDDVKDKPIINELISNNVIGENDMEKSVLDLIASFWYAGNESIARNISEEILSGIDVCLNLTVGTDNMYSSCDDQPKNIAVASRIETGYEIGKPTYGYMARAFLKSIRGKTTSSYAYFGGYVGDGNITIIIELPDNANVLSVEVEADVGSEFTLYINDNHAGTYTPTTENMTADSWFVCNETNPSYCSFLSSGNNEIEINFTSQENSYIGGGYIRVKYNTSELAPLESYNQSKYRFPGIQGIINLYSSFYVPGRLESMSARLHLKSDYNTFLNVGNQTVFSGNTTDEVNVTLSNSSFSMLDYDFLSERTIPMRFGTEAVETVGVGVGDAMLVTDVSGSMEWCSNEPFGQDPHTSWQWKTWQEGGITYGSWRWVPNSPCDNNAKRNIEIAREANTMFVDTVLNTSGNRVGLVDYTGNYWVYNYNIRRWFIQFPDHLAGVKILTDKQDILQDHIDKMETWWGTCTCCGINKAVKTIEQHSDPSRVKSLVVMSDGDANIECSEQDTGDAKQDAIKAGQDACANNITVYTVGYGEGADENTLRQIACDESKYYRSSNVSQLIEIYKEIAEEIAKASYRAQTINITGTISTENVLYPDSYIEFNYIPVLNPFEYGEIELTRQTERLKNLPGFNSNESFVEADYYIPENVKVVDERVTSYSSQYWTDRVYVDDNMTRVYWLGDYGEDYSLLGDPYSVQIPANLIEEGQTNHIVVGTGLSPVNSTGGSGDDRIIYDIRVKGSVGYGDVFNSSSLAKDDAIQRLKDETGGYVSVDDEDIEVDSKNIKGIQWLWGPSLLKVIAWEKT